MRKLLIVTALQGEGETENDALNDLARINETIRPTAQIEENRPAGMIKWFTAATVATLLHAILLTALYQMPSHNAAVQPLVPVQDPREAAWITGRVGARWTANGDYLIDNQLPPLEYDHLYAGIVYIERFATVAQVTAKCKQAWPTLDRDVLACRAYKTQDTCVIYITSDDTLALQKLTFGVVLRHEMGHCNGWSGRHEGGRPWVSEIKQ